MVSRVVVQLCLGFARIRLGLCCGSPGSQMSQARAVGTVTIWKDVSQDVIGTLEVRSWL